MEAAGRHRRKNSPNRLRRLVWTGGMAALGSAAFAGVWLISGASDATFNEAKANAPVFVCANSLKPLSYEAREVPAGCGRYEPTFQHSDLTGDYIVPSNSDFIAGNYVSHDKSLALGIGLTAFGAVLAGGITYGAMRTLRR